MTIHVIDKNNKLLFTMAEDRVKDSADCKIVDKLGMKKFILQCNFESEMKETIQPLNQVKKQNLMDNKEYYL